MKIKIDLCGKIFGRWTVVSKEPLDKYSHKKWKCICSCGTEKSVNENHLLTNQSVSCGCLKLEKSRLENAIEVTQREVWRSNYKELPFDIFLHLSQQLCHYCGSEASNKHNALLRKNTSDDRKKSAWFIYNGLDRIDSSKGHTADNVVTCCKYCNYAKLDRSYKDFLNWVNRSYYCLKKKGEIDD